MMAYSDGDLCEAIRRGILSNETIVGEFMDLCNNVEHMPLDILVRQNIMAFGLERYVNMRGRWFLKIMKGHRKGFQDDVVSGKAATRTKVAATIACSKAKAAVMKEHAEIQRVYSNAASNLLDRADDDDDEDSIHSE